MELEEVEHILDPSTLPKRTKAKQDLLSVGELRCDMTDLSFLEISKQAGPLLVFLEKLSDKSSGMSGRLVRELRASTSLSGHSPPHKKLRHGDVTIMKEASTQMEIEMLGSPDPINVPLPSSPEVTQKKVMIDRGCSPIWDDRAITARPIPTPDKSLRNSGFGAVSPGARDLTTLEQSLLDHIETLFAQRNSTREDIYRIRRDLEDPGKGSVSSVAERQDDDMKPSTAKKRKKRIDAGRRAVIKIPSNSQAQLGAGAVKPLSRSEAAVTTPESGQWSKVVGRKGRRRTMRELVPSVEPSPSIPGGGFRTGIGDASKTGQRVTTRVGAKNRRSLRPRPPTTAAVSVTIRPGAGLSYKDAMAEARSKIDLSNLGITNSRLRRAATGGILIQISGKDHAAQADDLASKMDAVLGGKGVLIGRPSRCAELRVRGIDVSVAPEDLAEVIAKAGGCRREDVRIDQIQYILTGLGSVWVKCPALAAKKMVGLGSIRVGWGRATVKPLRPRPMVCYRCLEQGHVRQRCASKVDRGNRCFRCGNTDHRVTQCMAEPRCPYCTDFGLPAGHVLGGGKDVPFPPPWVLLPRDAELGLRFRLRDWSP